MLLKNFGRCGYLRRRAFKGDFALRHHHHAVCNLGEAAVILVNNDGGDAFTPDDAGTHTFSVTLSGSGNTTLSVFDVADPALPSSGVVSVKSSGGGGSGSGGGGGKKA